MGMLSYLYGKNGEKRGEEYLIEQGFMIVERNFHSRFGEIDIIAKKDGVLHFIEVKYSKKYNPIYNITPQKLQKILKTIDNYILRHSCNIPYQIDALIIQDREIEFLENISIM